MNERQNLVENYADAAFSLLMDDLAGAEAERLRVLNEALRADDSAAVPEDVYRRCIDKLDQAFRDKQRAQKKLHARKRLRILPIAATLLLALAALAYAAFPQFQVGVKNLFLRESPHATTWSFTENLPSLTLEDVDSAFTMELPNGFFLTEFYKSTMMEYMEFQSESDPDAFIALSLALGDNTSASVDNDGYTEKQEVMINGNPGTFYVNDQKIWMVWASKSPPIIHILDSVGLSEDDVLRFAESVTYLGESG